jgi:hypothetical protein
MPNVATIVVGTAQIDGRVYVTETYVDSAGVTHVSEYLSDPVANFSAIAAARGLAIEAYMLQDEMEDVLETMGAFTLKYATIPQLVAYFRATYKTATGLQAAYMATWLLNLISTGVFTDLQVQTAFGLTTPQYTVAKANLTTVANNYNAALAAVGA